MSVVMSVYICKNIFVNTFTSEYNNNYERRKTKPVIPGRDERGAGGGGRIGQTFPALATVDDVETDGRRRNARLQHFHRFSVGQAWREKRERGWEGK